MTYNQPIYFNGVYYYTIGPGENNFLYYNYNYNNNNNLIQNNNYNSTNEYHANSNNPNNINFANNNQNIITNGSKISGQNFNQNQSNNNQKNIYIYTSNINDKKIAIEKKEEKIPNKVILHEETKISKKPCAIINYGNNCYLNSGLQILSSCNSLVQELNKYKDFKIGLIGLMNEAFYKITKEDIYDPQKLFSYFCFLNKEPIRVQYCSQNFIRKILKNLNDELIKIGDIHYITEYVQYQPRYQLEREKYLHFIEENKKFPESFSLKLFTGISKFHSFGICQYCNEKNEDFSFNYFIDQNIYLDNFSKKCYFSTVLFENIGKMNSLTINCKKCKRGITIKEETKYIKLPEILIFTLERYKEIINNVEIIPEPIIDFKKYLDNSINLRETKYELFAINLRYGTTRDFGHEICQVKRDGDWYEINDTEAYKRINEHNQNSYGLFYRRIINN